MARNSPTDNSGVQVTGDRPGSKGSEDTEMGELAKRVASAAAATIPTTFRVMFGGESFPLGLLFTQEFLKPYPHIQAEAVPHDEVGDRVHEYDMCVCRTARFNSNTISRAKKLKVIAQFGMGLEGVDVDAATRMGIRVARIPSEPTGNALSCAEYAIYLMLSLLRNQRGLDRSVREKLVGEPHGKTLFNSTVFIVGYGSIGKELSPRLKPFGVRVLAIRPSWNNKYPTGAFQQSDGLSTSGDEDPFVDRKGGMEHLHEFNSQADIVVLCCPLTPKTKGMVNDSFLASMKPGALLVNVARGGLMDYDAVTAALKSGRLGGLGTDVTWVEPFDPQDPLIQHPNVVITPHVAGVTEFAYKIMAQVIATSAVQLYEGKTITGLEFVN